MKIVLTVSEALILLDSTWNSADLVSEFGAMVRQDESNWRVTEIVAGGQGAIEVQADFAALPATCLKCGSTRRPRRYGALTTSYRDAPFLGRQVVITVNLQRFRCADCGQAFFQELSDMDCKRRMTARCSAYIIDQVMARNSMKDVANIIGVDEKSVRNVFDDRGLIFTVGDAQSDDRFVCECCMGIHPKMDLHMAQMKHFGRWRKGELRHDANVCAECFVFPQDPWRAGVVKRL